MATITYAYDAGSEVWIITDNNCDPAVVSGLVIQVRGTALTTGTTIEYDIRLAGQDGTTPLAEADIFATLNDAVTEYETRLTV